MFAFCQFTFTLVLLLQVAAYLVPTLPYQFTFTLVLLLQVAAYLVPTLPYQFTFTPVLLFTSSSLLSSYVALRPPKNK